MEEEGNVHVSRGFGWSLAGGKHLPPASHPGETRQQLPSHHPQTGQQHKGHCSTDKQAHLETRGLSDTSLFARIPAWPVSLPLAAHMEQT